MVCKTFVLGLQTIIILIHNFLKLLENQIFMNKNIFFNGKLMLLVGGIITVFLLPPFQAPDEFNHFFRAWQIAQGDWVAWRLETPQGGRVGGRLPKNLLDLAQPYQNLPFDKNAKINLETLKKSLDIKQNLENQTFIDFVNTAVYAPTAYLPQSLAIFLGKILQLPPLSIFWLSRLFAFFTWCLLLFWALRCLRPLFAMHDTLLLLALLPASLGINATASADVVTNGLSFYLIAIFFRKIALNEFFTNKDFLNILWVSCVISLNKIAYLPLLGSFFLLPKNIFGVAKWTKNKFLSILFLSNVLCIIVWLSLCKWRDLMITFEAYHPIFRVGQQLNEGVNSLLQFHFILENPFKFLKICFYSLFKTFPHTLIHYVGKFGWEKNYLPFPILILSWLLITIQSFLTARVTPLSRSLRWGIRVVAFGGVLSFSAVMYLIWSPVGASFIDNLAGKYFIPIFPYFFLSFTQTKFSFIDKLFQKNNISNYWTPQLLRGGIWIIWVVTFWAIYRRYYF